MALILVRHTTPAVAPGTCYGRLDVPVAPDLFAAEAAQVMQALPVTRPGQLLSSPLQRCRRLADHLGYTLGLAPDYVDGLAEMDFGAWEGLAWDDVPRDELDAWAADFDHAAPHGGESVASFRRRVEATLAPLHAAAQTALVVTHAGVMRVALAMAGHDDPWQASLAYGQVLEFADTWPAPHAGAHPPPGRHA